MNRTTSISTLAVCLTLAACGGSGSSSSTTSRITRGTITARSAGAMTVNGIQLSTASASVRADGKTVPEDSLHKGMVVTIHGSFDDRAGEAAQIETEHAVEGQVEAKGDDYVVIGGQRVNIDDSTEFDAAHATRLSSVSVGDDLAVSGVADDHGGVRASRVDTSARQAGPPSAQDDFDLLGFVSNFVAGTSFELRISPDATAHYLVLVSGLTLPAGVKNGARVEIHSLAPPTIGVAPLIGTVTASSVEVEDGLEAADEQGQMDLEGIVTSGAAASFVIEGVTVVTDGSTAWSLGGPADLVPGVAVEAEGQVDGAGVLHASKVSFRAGARITAEISGYDGVSMTLLGVHAQIPSYARVDPSLTLANGLRVEVRGNPAASGSGVVALRIVPPSGGSSSRVFVRAVATTKSNATPSAPSFTVLGFTVGTAGASFKGASGEILTADQFFAAVEAGRTVVKARAPSAASVSGAAFAADELEIEGNE